MSNSSVVEKQGEKQTQTQLKRVSKSKKVSRWLNTKHANLFTIVSSIGFAGLFYVNMYFNWVTGAALGGIALGLGCVFLDCAMKAFADKFREAREKKMIHIEGGRDEKTSNHHARA